MNAADQPIPKYWQYFCPVDSPSCTPYVFICYFAKDIVGSEPTCSCNFTSYDQREEGPGNQSAGGSDVAFNEMADVAGDNVDRPISAAGTVN
jgi:hypothetical protein